MKIQPDGRLAVRATAPHEGHNGAAQGERQHAFLVSNTGFLSSHGAAKRRSESNVFHFNLQTPEHLSKLLDHFKHVLQLFKIVAHAFEKKILLTACQASHTLEIAAGTASGRPAALCGPSCYKHIPGSHCMAVQQRQCRLRLSNSSSWP
eukprot:jgi/Botrbrau1/13805/Bobra.0056s0053.1